MTMFLTDGCTDLVVDAGANSVTALLETSKLSQHVLVRSPHLEAVDTAPAGLRRTIDNTRPCPAVCLCHGHSSHNNHNKQWTETWLTHVVALFRVFQLVSRTA